MVNIKRLTIYVIFCATLFIGLLLGENSSGGAKIDHEYLFPFIEQFSNNFEKGFYLFINNSGSLIHSPIFYLISGFILKISNSIFFLKFFNILISCLVPYTFYLILKKKFKNSSNYIFFFSLLIFLSPYFRSSAIWILGDNLSLLFFSLSILFFLKYQNEKKEIINCYLSFLFLIFCCYIRYYYCVFAVYYLYYFYRDLELKSFLKIISFSLIISTPSFIYLFHMINNYNFFGAVSTFGYFNYYSSGLIILSIILFYLLPFVCIKQSPIILFYKKNPKNMLLFFFPISILYLIDKFLFYNLINFSSGGGGVFLKISHVINVESNFFISIIAFISLLVVDFLFRKNRFENYCLLIILILCFPLFSIYQKYLDPLIYLFFFGLINSVHLREIIIKSAISLKFLYSYFLFFFIFSNFYYLGVF